MESILPDTSLGSVSISNDKTTKHRVVAAVLSENKEAGLTEIELNTVQQADDNNKSIVANRKVQLIDSSHTAAVLKALQLEHNDLNLYALELHDRLVSSQKQHEIVVQEAKQLQRDCTTYKEQLQLLYAELEKDAIAYVLPDVTSIETMKRSIPTVGIAGHIYLLQHLVDTIKHLTAANHELSLEASCHEHSTQIISEKLQEHQIELEQCKNQLSEAKSHIDVLQQASQCQLAKFQEKLNTDVIETKESYDSQHKQFQEKYTELDKVYRNFRLEMDQKYNQLLKEKEQLGATLSNLESKARARLDEHIKDEEFLQQFKLQLIRGFPVLKYGMKGAPHKRMLLCDPKCEWITWSACDPMSPSYKCSPSNRKTVKIEIRDIVHVVEGANTESFQRHRSTKELKTSERCFSLISVRPCRTIDLEIETQDLCQYLIHGFRLLQEHMHAY